MNEHNLKQTTDIWLAAFLMKKGMPVAKYEVITRGRVSLSFMCSDEDWNKHKLEFSNSEISEYKAIIGKIRDLGY